METYEITRIEIANRLYSQLSDNKNMPVHLATDGVSREALMSAVEAIVEFLEYEPDATENDIDRPRAEHAERRSNLWVGAMDKWFMENPSSSYFVDQYAAEFGTDHLSEAGSGLIYCLISGGMWMEAFYAWDWAWTLIADNYAEACDE